MLALTSASAGTPVIPYKIDVDNAEGRSKAYPDEKNTDRFSIMKYVEAREDRQAGVLVFDSKESIHSLKRVPYSSIELMSKGPGTTVLVAGAKIPEKMHRAPAWYLYFETDQLPPWIEPIKQQLYGLALSTITNSIWTRKLRERSNSVFTEMLPILYKLCRVSL